MVAHLWPNFVECPYTDPTAGAEYILSAKTMDSPTPVGVDSLPKPSSDGSCKQPRLPVWSTSFASKGGAEKCVVKVLRENFVGFVYLRFGLNQKATRVSSDSAQLPVGTTSTITDVSRQQLRWASLIKGR